MTNNKYRSSKNKMLSRRKFLGYAGSTSILGLSSSPVVALFSVILGGQSQKAWAASLGIKPRNFVQITQGGAPARWMVDPLTPYTSTGLNLNPMVGTKFKNVGGRYVGVEYETVARKGIQVPTMWTHDLPTASNGYRPMADLLDNYLCIQGVTTRNAGHESSQMWQFLAPGAQKSTSAMSADASNAPFAALNVGASGYTFKSTQNKTALSLSNGGNIVSTLLDPFKPMGGTQFKVNRSTIQQAYNSLLPSLDELARAGHPGAEALVQNRGAAMDLVQSNFANLDIEWNALLNKYKALVTKAIFDPTKPLPGVNDLPIGEGGTGAMALYQIGDTSALNLHLSTDFRSAVGAQTSVGNLATGFAFTEYVLKNQLSSSIAFGVGSIGPFIRESDNAAMESMGNDQHQSGVYPSTYFNILTHRAIATCLMELSDRLKAANMWNDTVVGISGEFNRNPKVDLTGSDHGFTGKSLSLYSGAFNGPLVVGNIKNDDRLGWGAGGTVAQLGRQLNLVDTAVTIAHVIGVPAPFTSTGPVVTLGSGGLISNIGTTKVV